MDNDIPEFAGPDVDAWTKYALTDASAAIRAALEPDSIDLLLEMAVRKLGPGGQAWWERLLLDLRTALPKGDGEALNAFKRTVTGFSGQAREVQANRSFQEARRRDLEGVEAREGWEILDEVHDFLCHYQDFTLQAQVDAVTLFVMHTHAIGSFDTTPRLHISSRIAQSGKTRLLEMIGMLVQAPLSSIGLSPAALFRTVGAKEEADNFSKKAADGKLTLEDVLITGLQVDFEAQRRTVLVDEIDTVFGPKAQSNNEPLRGVLNAGYRRGATVPRVVGNRVVEFPIFAAVVLCGLGGLPDTLADRSILILLQKSRKKMPKLKFRTARPVATRLRRQMAAWAEARQGILQEAEPEVPDELDSRASEIWEPLVAIADLAGGDWPERARAAAVSLFGAQPETDDDLPARLLADIRTVFQAVGVDRITTVDLLEQLNRQLPWGSFRKGGAPLHGYGLHQLLKPFGIPDTTVRFGNKVARGYKKEWFEKAWDSGNDVTELPLEVAPGIENVADADGEG